MIALEADYTLVDGALTPNLVVVLGDDGRIADLGGRERYPQRTRLSGQVLLPGLVNGHSHAFQRALRGRTERHDTFHSEDNFWTWRDQMYTLASRLTPELLHAISRMAYLEMLLGGITAVGEFHYVHHGPDGTPYANPDELALQVAAAAKETGIHQVLLRVAYARAGYQRTLAEPQKRFIDRDVAHCLDAVVRLQAAGLECGIAPHSVRGVPREWLGPLHDFAVEGQLPFHVHVAEQPAEIEACLAEHQLRPVQLLAAEGFLDARTTAVHAIHLEPAEVRALGTARSTVCICPTTERNLGDGIAPADRLLEAGAAMSLGSDSHTQINLLEDAREVEYHLRLQNLSRVVLSNGSDLARRLWSAATEGGGRSLGMTAGLISPGRRADLFSIDHNDPSVCAEDTSELFTNIVFSLERTAIRNVWVGGRPVIEDGRHREAAAIVATYRKAVNTIWNR